jgi:hypothetical protein
MFAGGVIGSSIAPRSDRTGMAEQIRRRRAASYRCLPLASGVRDPLDAQRRRGVVAVRAIGKSTVEAIGCDRAVYDVLKTVGGRYQRAPRGGAWLMPQEIAEDVLTMLSGRGYTVEYTL